MEGQETKLGKHNAIELWNEEQVKLEPCSKCGSPRIIRGMADEGRVVRALCLECNNSGGYVLSNLEGDMWRNCTKAWNEEQRQKMEETVSTTMISQRDEDGYARITERHDTVTTGQESSVEIAQNSKGEPRVTVKVYNADVEEARRLALKTYCEMVRDLGVGE